MNAAAETGRIARRFEALKAESRAALITFVTAGDPDAETSLEILKRLPEAGADLLEIGMPFSDPMADGPAIQAAGLRALAAGQSMAGTLDMVRSFRAGDADTPIILMGYFNPIHRYGPDRFLADAREAGVDGLIIVDLPPEEDAELCAPALAAGLNFIRLVTPTTDDDRLPKVLTNTSGFVYYVSIAGITGTRSAGAGDLRTAVERLRSNTALPVAIGFGLKTPQQVAEVAGIADAAVVGSALVSRIADGLDAEGRPRNGMIDYVIGFARTLADGVRSARTVG